MSRNRFTKTIWRNASSDGVRIFCYVVIAPRNSFATASQPGWTHLPLYKAAQPSRSARRAVQVIFRVGFPGRPTASLTSLPLSAGVQSRTRRQHSASTTWRQHSACPLGVNIRRHHSASTLGVCKQALGVNTRRQHSASKLGVAVPVLCNFSERLGVPG